MSNELTTTEQATEQSQTNVINYNPVFPTLTASVLLDLPVENMIEDLLKLDVNTDNYSGGWTTYFSNQNIDNVRGAKELKEAIYGVSCAFAREMKYEVNYDKCSIRVWANVMRKGGYHVAHDHKQATISGTFYARVEDDMSPLVFKNPTSIYRAKEPFIRPEDMTAFTSENLVVVPKVNTMVLWPSWMSHEVLEMKVPGPRISFSFNVDFLPPGV